MIKCKDKFLRYTSDWYILEDGVWRLTFSYEVMKLLELTKLDAYLPDDELWEEIEYLARDDLVTYDWDQEKWRFVRPSRGGRTPIRKLPNELDIQDVIRFISVKHLEVKGPNDIDEAIEDALYDIEENVVIKLPLQDNITEYIVPVDEINVDAWLEVQIIMNRIVEDGENYWVFELDWSTSSAERKDGVRISLRSQPVIVYWRPVFCYGDLVDIVNGKAYLNVAALFEAVLNDLRSEESRLIKFMKR